MEEPVKLRVSSVLLGPYKLKGDAYTHVTRDFLKLRVKLGAESLRMNLSSASIETFEIFHDPNVGGGMVVHIYPSAARKIQGICELGSDAFLKYESAFSGSGISKQLIVLDILNCDSNTMGLLRTKLVHSNRYHDAHWQHKLVNAPAQSPRASQSIVFISVDKWRCLLASFGQALHSEMISMVTLGRRRTFMSSAIVSMRAVSPPNAVEAHQEAREQSSSVHDVHENTDADAQEEAALSNADAAVARVPNLRKRKGEPLTNWGQAFEKVRHRPLEETREQIIEQSAGDLVVLSRTRISLICPISGRRIETAARGVGCTHLECFDLAAYLKQQTQTPYWVCPFAFCDQAVHLKDLIIDDYFNHALRTSHAGIEEIELQSDGLFEPVQVDVAVSEREKVVVVEFSDDEDLEVHGSSLPPGHDLDRMLVVGAEMCGQLQSALQNLEKQLQTFNFVYLNGVKESFGELHDFARTHFGANGNEMHATAVPLGVAKELHNRSTKVFRQLNELGSKKALNDVAHGLVALNSLIKQHIVGAPKSDP